MFDRIKKYANGCGGIDEDFEKHDMPKIFEKIYQTGLWVKYAKKEDANSLGGDGSGYGSDPENNAEFLKKLTTIVEENNIQSVVDFGCGSHYMYNDYTWPQTVKEYIGYDVSTTAVQRARKNCKHKCCKFEYLEDYDKINQADLLIVKDVFQHWPERFVVDFLEKNLYKYKHIVVCGNPQETVNKEYFDWDWAEQLSYSEHQMFYKRVWRNW